MSRPRKIARVSTDPGAAEDDITPRDEPTDVTHPVTGLNATPPETSRQEASTSGATAVPSGADIRLTLRCNLQRLSESLDVSELKHALYEQAVLTTEDYEHVLKVEENKGATAAVKLLLTKLQDKSEHALQTFWRITAADQPEIQQLKVDERRVLSGVVAEVEARYSSLRYNEVPLLMGESLVLDVTQHQYLMPLDFTAKRKVVKQTAFKPQGQQEVGYEWVGRDEYKHIRSLASSMLRTKSRTILCTAAAGTGKTVLVHALAYDWMARHNQPSGVSKYYLVISLHVRNIDLDLNIPDILSTGKGCAGFISKDKVTDIEFLLTHEASASKILILIDGIDEKEIPRECQLYQLITGELYPHVKVLGTLAQFQPDYKVVIRGTTAEGVKQYLLTVLSLNDTPATDQQVDDIIQQCHDQMVDDSFLRVPIYLSLIGFLFQDYWSQHLSLKAFTVPKSASELLVSFLKVFVRVWCQRLNKGEVDFSRSPLGADSTVPVSLKRVLLNFGQMSWKALLNEQYDFTDKDLADHVIDIDDIKQSGLFSIADNSQRVFLKHKQLQEFLAALHLTHVRFKEPEFKAMIEQTESQCLANLFRKIQWIVLFAVGVEPEFGAELLRRLSGRVSVIWQSEVYEGCDHIKLWYESRLVAEARHAAVSEAMGDLLVTAPVLEDNHYYPISCPTTCVLSLCEGLTEVQRLSLLEKWYGLYTAQTRGDRRWCVGHAEHQLNILSSNDLYIGLLGDICYGLLRAAGVYDRVESLRVGKSDISDVSHIQGLFPRLHTLCVEDCGDELDSALTRVSSHSPPPTLTHITLGRGYDDLTLSAQSVSGLLSQTHLQSLTLRQCDILTNMADVTCDISWPQLHTLDMCLRSITADSDEPVHHNLVRVLQHTPALTTLRFGCVEYGLPLPEPDSLIDALQSLPSLHTMCLHSVLHPSDLAAVCRRLTDLTQLTTLGLGWMDIRGGLDGHNTITEDSEECLQEIEQGLRAAPHVNQLLVVYGRGNERRDRDTAASVLRQLESYSDQLTVNIRLYDWKKDRVHDPDPPSDPDNKDCDPDTDSTDSTDYCSVSDMEIDDDVTKGDTAPDPDTDSRHCCCVLQ